MGTILIPIFYTEDVQRKRFKEVELNDGFSNALISPSRYARNNPKMEDKFFMDYLSKEVGESEDLFERITIANTMKPKVGDVLCVISKIRKWVSSSPEFKNLVLGDNDYYFLDEHYFLANDFPNDLRNFEEMLLASPIDALVDCEFST